MANRVEITKRRLEDAVREYKAVQQQTELNLGVAQRVVLAAIDEYDKALMRAEKNAEKSVKRQAVG